MTLLFSKDILSECTDSQNMLIEENFNEALVERIHAGSLRHKMRQITSRLMLIEIFKRMNLNCEKLKTLYYNEHGKLLVSDGSLYLSLTYSQNKAICGISTSKIGIDMEDLRTIVPHRNIRLLEKWTNMKIRTSLDFYRIWTKTESIAKLYDKGGLNNLLSEPNFFKKPDCTHYIFFKRHYLIAISS